MSNPVFRTATRDDLPAIVAELADDELGRTREQAGDPLPAVYYDAFAAMCAQGNNHYLLAIVDDDV